MIRQTEVDGVTTLVAPKPGPMRAGLTFRVGRADETLARGGVTHLLEHLALHHWNSSDYHFNGTTGTTMTSFFLEGSTDDVGTFLRQVCDALSRPPIDRLPLEKEILRTEAANRTRSVVDQLPLWRYGARTYGLVAYPEWGLPMIGVDEISHWAARFFTIENAVLWIAGDDVPAGLRLPLPAGVRQPLPAPSSALPVTPAFFAGPPQAIALQTFVSRSAASAVWAHVLERELYRSLRQESGLSYTATTDYGPMDAVTASVVALADTRPDAQDAALGAFVDVLAKLRVGRIEQSDVDTVVAKQLEVYDHPELAAARLPGAAFNVLVGSRNETIDELRDEVRRVSATDIWTAANRAAGSALLMVPDGQDAEWAGFTAAPIRSTGTVTGTAYRSRTDADTNVIIGTEGASLVRSGDTQTTVRYADCAALLRWPDGGRMLIGNDAMTLRIEPTIFGLDATAVMAIDAAVPLHLSAVLPARAPSEIPHPGPAPGAPTADRSADGRPGIGETILLVVLAIAAVGVTCLGGAGTIGGIGEEAADAWYWGIVGCVWVVAVLMGAPAVWLYRRRIRARPPGAPR